MTNKREHLTTLPKAGAFVAVALLLVAAAATPTNAIEHDATPSMQNDVEIFRGIVISMGTLATGRNSSLNMHITDWTSPSQRQVLLNALRAPSSDEESLFNVMRSQPEKGFLQVLNTPGTIRLKYAWQTVADDGSRTITMIADNLLPIFVTQGTARLKEQQFTMIHLEVDADGTGSGSMAYSASISWDAEAERIKIGIESTEPLRITSVRKVQ